LLLHPVAQGQQAVRLRHGAAAIPRDAVLLHYAGTVWLEEEFNARYRLHKDALLQ
jgi:hypothetical protein